MRGALELELRGKFLSGDTLFLLAEADRRIVGL